MIVEIAWEDWISAGVERYGDDRMKWKFRCPVCGHVADANDYKAAGAEQGVVGFSCIGRYLDKRADAFEAKGRGVKGPCNYAGGGLFKLNPIHVTHEGETSEWFDFADRPLAVDK